MARLPSMNAFIARVVLRAVQCDLTALATMSKEDMVHRIPKSVPDHRVLALHAYLHLEAQGSLPEDAGDEAAQTDAIMAVEEYVRPCTRNAHALRTANHTTNHKHTPHAALHTKPTLHGTRADTIKASGKGARRHRTSARATSQSIHEQGYPAVLTNSTATINTSSSASTSSTSRACNTSSASIAKSRPR